VKAVFADFFIENAQAGFSNLIFQFGFSATVTFFAFPNASDKVKGWVCLVTSLLSGVGYLWAMCIERRRRTEQGDYESIKDMGRKQSVGSSVKIIPEPL